MSQANAGPQLWKDPDALVSSGLLDDGGWEIRSPEGAEPGYRLVRDGVVVAHFFLSSGDTRDALVQVQAAQQRAAAH